MKTKTIFSIALIALLPLTAKADPVVSVGPAAVPSNGTAVVATATPPYQTLTPTNEDKQHIASTAYVKGAYNDSIAAVNKVADTVSDLADTVDGLSSFVNNDIEDEIDGKQDKFSIFESDEEIDTEILDDYMFNEYAKSGFTDDSGFDMSTHLVTAQGVASGIIGFLYSGLGYGPRVRVYTTWDNDNASRGVSIEDASQFQ